MSLLEAKLLKREIKDSVFEKLIKERESEIIKKEKELMDVVFKGLIVWVLLKKKNL